jgi:carbonic anhydrase
MELPIHEFYETFFLLLALADYAFRDYSSIDDILNAAEAYKTDYSDNKILEVIHFADSVRDVPLICPSSELQTDKCTGKARGADAFGKVFAKLGHRSGYTRKCYRYHVHSEEQCLCF